MLDINLLRNDPEKVRENIRKKFQEEKLPMVDEVIRMDREYRDAQQQADGLRNKRKTLSKQIGALIGQGKKDEAEAVKAEVAAAAEELAALEVKEEELKAEIRKRMLVIPNIIDDSVPIGRTTARMWRSSASASPWCRPGRFPTMWISWNACTESNWIPPGKPAATVSTT